MNNQEHWIHDQLMNLVQGPEINEEEEKQKFPTFIRLQEKIERAERKKAQRRTIGKAAFILLFIGSAVLNLYQVKLTSPTDAEWIAHKVPNGVISEITLPDGSKVKVNGGSEISYPTHFAEDIREITFTGEGYFNVAKDAKKPFIVNCHGTRTRVLGTTFNLKGYSATKISLFLESGKVALSNSKAEVIMSPGQYAECATEGEIIKHNDSQGDEFLGWRSGKLYFNEATLAEVAETLEHKYNVEITIKGNKDNYTFSGDFVHNETLEEIIRVMSMDKRLKVVHENRRVLITIQ